MSKEFFIKRGGKVRGPYALDFLINNAKQGKLFSSDEISKTADGPWALTSSKEELEIILKLNSAKRKKSLKVKDYKVITKQAAEDIYEIEYTCPKCSSVITMLEKEVETSFHCPSCNIRSKIAPESLDEIASQRVLRKKDTSDLQQKTEERPAIISLKDKAKAAAKATALAAERTTITNFSLPDAHAALGKYCFKAKRWKDEFPKNYKELNQLSELIANSKEKAEEGHTARKGLMDKVKNLAGQGVEAAKVQKYTLSKKSSFAKFGQAVFDKYGEESGPPELVKVITSLRKRITELETDLSKQVTKAGGKKWLVPSCGIIGLAALLLLLVRWPSSSNELTDLPNKNTEQIAKVTSSALEIKSEMSKFNNRLNNIGTLGKEESAKRIADRDRLRNESEALDKQRKQEAREQQAQREQYIQQRKMNEEQKVREAEEKQKELNTRQLSELERVFSTFNINPNVHIAEALSSEFDAKTLIKGEKYNDFKNLQEEKDWLGLMNLVGRRPSSIGISSKSWTPKILPSLSEIDYTERNLRSLIGQLFLEVKNVDLPVHKYSVVSETAGYERETIKKIRMYSAGGFTGDATKQFTSGSRIFQEGILVGTEGYWKTTTPQGKIYIMGVTPQEDMRLIFKWNPGWFRGDLIITYLTDQENVNFNKKYTGPNVTDSIAFENTLKRKIELGELQHEEAIKMARDFYEKTIDECIEQLVKYNPN